MKMNNTDIAGIVIGIMMCICAVYILYYTNASQMQRKDIKKYKLLRLGAIAAIIFGILVATMQYFTDTGHL